MAPKKAIEFSHITFGYTPDMINLDDVSFSIYENEYVCVIGHNGSGKSTMSKVLTGLLKPQKGIIKLFDQEINQTNLKHLRDNIGIVFQNPDNQFIGLTPEDDIAFGLENRKILPSKMWPIIKEVAQAVNITKLLKLDAAKLSGGQKQRVAIASVLAINPKVIIFDESTSMLDPKGKADLKELMLILKNKFHKTVVSITHDMEEVVNADKVIILKGGRLQIIGTPQQVFENQEFLKEIQLDIPFNLNLSKKLAELDSRIKPSLKLDNLINQLYEIKK